MRSKEFPPSGESLWERACRHIRFPLNQFVGQRDNPNITYHLDRLGECVSEIEKQGGNPTELINVVEEMSKNYGGLPPRKQRIAASIMNILMGKEPPKFP
ncbi:MAG: hypothetical protein LiPW31_200 [Microgenomates group bacterium LiPW_31]|nr:MAG: hypothetical protein LiPW31_200 [Microgenomates group bacterium LiPW_31]